MPEATQEQVNQLYKTLGLGLLSNSIGILQKIYTNLTKNIFYAHEIKDCFVAHGFESIPISEADYSFAFITKEQAEPMVNDIQILLNKFGYKSEYTDCDNFANLCSSLFSFLYAVNTCGVIWGNIYNKDTGNLIAGHYFNIIVTYDPVLKKFELFLADPLNPGFIKIQKGVPIIMNNWKYEIGSSKFF